MEDATPEVLEAFTIRKGSSSLNGKSGAIPSAIPVVIRSTDGEPEAFKDGEDLRKYQRAGARKVGAPVPPLAAGSLKMRKLRRECLHAEAATSRSSHARRCAAAVRV